MVDEGGGVVLRQGGQLTAHGREGLRRPGKAEGQLRQRGKMTVGTGTAAGDEVTQVVGFSAGHGINKDHRQIFHGGFGGGNAAGLGEIEVLSLIHI